MRALASRLAQPLLCCRRSVLKTRMMSQNGIPNKDFNEHLENLGTNIFSVMTALSIEHKSINLGQVGSGKYGMPLIFVSSMILIM